MSFGPVGGLAVGEIALGTGSGGLSATVPFVAYGTTFRLTAAGAEVWGYSTAPRLQVTAAGAEVWGYNAAPALIVTAAGAEVWVDISTPYTPPVTNVAQPIVCVIT